MADTIWPKFKLMVGQLADCPHVTKVFDECRLHIMDGVDGVERNVEVRSIVVLSRKQIPSIGRQARVSSAPPNVL